MFILFMSSMKKCRPKLLQTEMVWRQTLLSLSRVPLFSTPGTSSCQAPLFFTVSRSLLRFMSLESMMPSNHLIFCRPLLLLPGIFPSIRVFSSESALHIRWPEYWRFSCNSDLVGFKSSFPKYHLT